MEAVSLINKDEVVKHFNIIKDTTSIQDTTSYINNMYKAINQGTGFKSHKSFMYMYKDGKVNIIQSIYIDNPIDMLPFMYKLYSLKVKSVVYTPHKKSDINWFKSLIQPIDAKRYHSGVVNYIKITINDDVINKVGKYV